MEYIKKILIFLISGTMGNLSTLGMFSQLMSKLIPYMTLQALVRLLEPLQLPWSYGKEVIKILIIIYQVFLILMQMWFNIFQNSPQIIKILLQSGIFYFIIPGCQLMLLYLILTGPDKELSSGFIIAILNIPLEVKLYIVI